MSQHSTKAFAAFGQRAQTAPPPSTSFSKWTRAPNASLQGATDADASRRVAASSSPPCAERYPGMPAGVQVAGTTSGTSVHGTATDVAAALPLLDLTFCPVCSETWYHIVGEVRACAAHGL